MSLNAFINAYTSIMGFIRPDGAFAACAAKAAMTPQNRRYSVLLSAGAVNCPFRTENPPNNPISHNPNLQSSAIEISIYPVVNSNVDRIK
jgi:hypothetical protein